MNLQEVVEFIDSFIEDDTEDLASSIMEDDEGWRMFLRLKWYTELANGMENVRKGRPALRIIFLMSAAEGVARMSNNSYGSQKDRIESYFDFISDENRDYLLSRINRWNFNDIGPEVEDLDFENFLEIVLNIRHRAVHGEEFWHFSFLEEENRRSDLDLAILTSGYEGNMNNENRVSLELTITYEDFRDIVVSTGLSFIQEQLN